MSNRLAVTVHQCPNTTVSVGALHPGLQCWHRHAAASAFRQPSPTCRTAFPGSKLTAVGRSHLLARWPGTHSQILSAIQRAAQTVLGVYLKRTCSRVTSASSALGVLTIMHYTNPRTQSLVHRPRYNGNNRPHLMLRIAVRPNNTVSVQTITSSVMCHVHLPTWKLNNIDCTFTVANYSCNQLITYYLFETKWRYVIYTWNYVEIVIDCIERT